MGLDVRAARCARGIPGRTRDHARPTDLDTEGLEISPAALASLLQIDKAQWVEELNAVGAYFDDYGDRLPETLRKEQQKVASKLR